MSLLSEKSRLDAGRWLHRYRKWGIIPLLITGLVLNIRDLTAVSGFFMLTAGAVGIFFGTMLRIVCFTFVGTKNPILESDVGGPATEGPYAITRNPVYLAEGSIALGIAMMSRMPWFVLATLLFGLIITALVIEWEEKMLRRRYGGVYEEYCHHVPRWFSLRRFIHPDSYLKTRGRVKLIQALRAESMTLLVGLLSILAFLAKADLEIIF